MQEDYEAAITSFERSECLPLFLLLNACPSCCSISVQLTVWWGRALKIDPEYKEAHCNRGAALDSLGLHQDAIDACDRCSTL